MPTTTTIPSTARIARTEEILDAATRLFSERGFTETGIDEIGAAIGVTGPAVYRYFARKEDLLVAVVDRAVEHATGLAEAARAGAESPDDTLRRLLDGAVAVCIADRALTAIYWHEARYLPAPQRRRVERVQRDMIEDFADILRDARPELTPERSAHGRVRGGVVDAFGRRPAPPASTKRRCRPCCRRWPTPRSSPRPPPRAEDRHARSGGSSRCFDTVQSGGRFSIHDMIPSSASGCSPTHHVSFVSRLIAAGRSAASMKS